jgi:hypothetical protein
MKGIVFNLLEEVIATHLGELAWDGLLERASVEGAYTSLGNYSDEEFSRILEALAELRQQQTRDTLRWFGHQSMPFLAERYPEFFTAHKSLRSFLLSLNDVIHAEVRKLYPGADVPEFGFDLPPPSDPAGWRLPRGLFAAPRTTSRNRSRCPSGPACWTANPNA